MKKKGELKSSNRKTINLMAAILMVTNQTAGPSLFGSSVDDKETRCKGCEHKEDPDGGWCYMFKEFQPGCQLNRSKG